jgi:hypothetical protein
LVRTTPQGPTPLFRITVVGHTTSGHQLPPAPRRHESRFHRTALSPLAVATQDEGKKATSTIDAKFDRLAPPTQFGPEYLTYVLWAVTPEDVPPISVKCRSKDDEARIHCHTELQAFGMIVTAEPYFRRHPAERRGRPENSVRNNTKGNVDVIQAKFDC